MNVNIEQQSYSTNIFRPQPAIYQEQDLLLVVTPWGNKDISENFAQSFIESFVSQPSTLTSDKGNEEVVINEELKIRTILSAKNQSVVNEFNAQEWNCGLEVSVLKQTKNQIAFSSIGHPSLYLKRTQRNLQPLGVNADLSMLLSGHQQNSVLPSQLLGAEENLNPFSLSFDFTEGDQILLISRTQIPSSLFQEKTNSLNLEACTQKLIDDDEVMPFWLAIITF